MSMHVLCPLFQIWSCMVLAVKVPYREVYHRLVLISGAPILPILGEGWIFFASLWGRASINYKNKVEVLHSNELIAMNIFEKEMNKSFLHFVYICKFSRYCVKIWQPLNNYEKYFLFHLKSFFFKIFKCLHIFLPFFCSFVHWFWGCLKIIFDVYDVINCLNKNSMTHFVWYNQKENRYDTETLSIDRGLNRENFYWKIKQKICTKS